MKPKRAATGMNATYSSKPACQFAIGRSSGDSWGSAVNMAVKTASATLKQEIGGSIHLPVAPRSFE